MVGAASGFCSLVNRSEETTNKRVDYLVLDLRSQGESESALLDQLVGVASDSSMRMLTIHR